MSRIRSLTFCTLAAGALAASAAAQPTLNNDFEITGSMYNKLFSYFGGVASYAVAPSPNLVYSGQSAQLTINYQPDAIFSSAACAIGSYLLTGAALNREPGADTFSITIDAGASIPAGKQLRLLVTLREDDDGDGAIDILGADDEWKSTGGGGIVLMPGRNVYNIPFPSFLDTDPDTGNGVRNFNTAGAMGLILEFQTRRAFPGGAIEVPVTLHLDHAGLFAGAQTIPSSQPQCPADFDDSGTVDATDIFVYLDAWFAQSGHSGEGLSADVDGSGDVSATDIFVFLDEWFTPC